MAAWTTAMHRDAVVLTLPRGAIPAVMDGVRRMAASFPVSGMVMAGAVVLGGTSPALVAPMLEGTTADKWIGRLFPAVRLVCEAGSTSGDGDEWIRIPLAERGHDLQWLVDTGGDIDADLVARTVGNLIGGMVAGAPVNALHPDSDAFGDMVAVRVPTDRATAIGELAASDMGLTITGRRCHLCFPSRWFARVDRGSGANPGRRHESSRPR